MLGTKSAWKKLLGFAVLFVCGGQTTQAMLAKGSKNVAKQQVEAVPGEFVLQLNASKSLSKVQLSQNLKALGMQLKATINDNVGLYLVRSVAGAKVNQVSALSSLNTMSGVQFAEPNFIYHAFVNADEVIPTGSMFSKLWGMKNTGQPDPSGKTGRAGADVSATKAWKIAQGSKDIVVAVIDTGVDYTHPALKDNMWTMPKASPTDPDVYGYNAIEGAAKPLDPFDDQSHGSHCAGTIGASGNNPDGVVGVNWNVKIMAVKFLTSAGSGTLADAIKGIDWAVEHGAQVLSNSWGGGRFSQALFDSITRASNKGVLFVAAAGNSKSNNDKEPAYPASYQIDNVLAVGASDNSDQLASFSNFGVKRVQVAAPGVNIYSTVPGPGRYDSFSGTSMACPHVAGAAALLLSKEPSLSFMDVKKRIIATADKIPDLSKKIYQGNRLNLFNMLQNIQPALPPSPPEGSWSAVVPNVIESAHPYASSTRSSWTVTHAGATYLKLKFGAFDTELGYDVVTLKNGKTGEVLDTFSGDLGATGFMSDEMKTDSIIVEFQSDSSVNRNGFVIEGYSWTAFTP